MSRWPAWRPKGSVGVSYVTRQSDSQCKGPEAGAGFVCPRSNNEADVAGAEMRSGSIEAPLGSPVRLREDANRSSGEFWAEERGLGLAEVLEGS